MCFYYKRINRILVYFSIFQFNFNTILVTDRRGTTGETPDILYNLCNGFIIT